MRLLAGLRAEEGGATAIEYGLIAGAVALALLTAYGTVGESLRTTFSEVSTAVTVSEQPKPRGGIILETRPERR